MFRLPYTIALALAAKAIAVAAALPLGIYSAIKPRSKVSYIVSVFSLVGASTPIFWIGLIYLYISSP